MPYTTLIATDILASEISNPDWVIIDCRFSLTDTKKGAEDYKTSHIPGARYAHLDRDLSSKIVPGTTGRHPLPNIDVFAEKLGAWGIDNATQVVAYDDMGGPFAARLWSMLRWLGHDAAAVLDGGWPKWIKEGRPVSRTVPARQTKKFIPHPNAHFKVNGEEVHRATQNPSICLLDARASERYAGTHEPIDPVAGHIPSALSFPWMDNLDANQCFLPPDALRKRFAGINTATAILYCGSGVTAAHNLLAIAHAGLPLPRLYAGSWSEWITSPHHEIATL